jgi:hypothetical protein
MKSCKRSRRLQNSSPTGVPEVPEGVQPSLGSRPKETSGMEAAGKRVDSSWLGMSGIKPSEWEKAKDEGPIVFKQLP